jgi:hypothetical protein
VLEYPVMLPQKIYARMKIRTNMYFTMFSFYVS